MFLTEVQQDCGDDPWGEFYQKITWYEQDPHESQKFPHLPLCRHLLMMTSATPSWVPSWRPSFPPHPPTKIELLIFRKTGRHLRTQRQFRTQIHPFYELSQTLLVNTSLRILFNTSQMLSTNNFVLKQLCRKRNALELPAVCEVKSVCLKFYCSICTFFFQDLSL